MIEIDPGEITAAMSVEVEKIWLACKRHDAARMKQLVDAAQERFGEEAVAKAFLLMLVENGDAAREKYWEDEAKRLGE